MPLVKATLQTALPTVRQLIGDLKKLARETTSSPAIDNLAQNLDTLDEYGGRKALDVELVTTTPLDPDEAGRLATWLGAGVQPARLQPRPGEIGTVEVPGPPIDLRVQVRAAGTRTAVRAGTPRAAILVVVATKPQLISAEDRAALERAFDDRPHVVLVASTKPLSVKPAAPEGEPPAEGAEGGEGAEAGAPGNGGATEGGGEAPAAGAAPGPGDDPIFKDLEAKARAGAWTNLVHRSLPDMTLQARLNTAPWDGFHDLFRAHASAVALESLANVYTMIFDQTQNEIRTNKAVTQQKLAKYGSPKDQKGPSPTADLLADLKLRVQRLSQEFERGAADRLQDMLGQPAGLLVRETEQLLASLAELQQEPRMKTMMCRVPPDFEEKVNRLIRERVGRHCAGDLVALNDLFRLITQEFERTLAQAQGPPIVVQFRYLTDERVRRMLDMYGIFQSQFKCDLPRPGFGEYFSSVRKYSMLLVMGASMFGMSAMLRQYREYMVPVTILLVAWGTYSVMINTKQQRIEQMEVKVEEARQSMRTEIRKIITDLQKQWTQILKDYLGDQINGALGELDAALKEMGGKKGGGEANPERDRLQRQLQALEASEKKMIASAKSRETVLNGITEVKGQLKALIPVPGAAPGMARPGMPGMPGMPRPGMPAGAGLAGARPGMPGMPKPGMPAIPKPAMPTMPKPAAAAGPSAASSAMADARAKMEAMKAARAAASAKPAAAAAAPAAPAAPAAAAPAAPAAAAPAAAAPAATDFKAKMEAMKAARAAAKPEAAAAAPAAAATPPPAAAAPAAAPAATDFKAKMEAMKAARAAAKPEAAPAAPAAEAAPAAQPAPAAAAAPAEAPPEEAPAAAAAAPAAKPAATDFKAKMEAMKAAREAAKQGAAAPAGGEAPAAAAKPAATDFKAKMEAMKAAREAAKQGAAAPAAAGAAPPAEKAPAEPAEPQGGERAYSETMAIPTEPKPE